MVRGIANVVMGCVLAGMGLTGHGVLIGTHSSTALSVVGFAAIAYGIWGISRSR